MSKTKVGLFLDVNDLYHAVNNSHGKKFNYSEFIVHCKNEYEVVFAGAYLDTSMDDGKKFQSMLKSYGYRVQVGDRRILYSVDSMRLINQLDMCIFGSTYDCYIPLYQQLMKSGKNVKLIGPPKETWAVFDVHEIIELTPQFLF